MRILLFCLGLEPRRLEGLRSLAWRHHWTRNPHHWEYWTVNPDGAEHPRPVPEVYAREMVADWYGAGMAPGKPDVASWYLANKDRMLLHESTRDLVTQLLQEAQRRGLVP